MEMKMVTREQKERMDKTTNTTEKESADDGRERRPEENLPLTLL
ncbi:hypothetical protein T12_1558 [Trichinella patagoniensis]|uniref:Uncharacterized protein n=1 Tax=Trichinella patagoniensis TaxID=990121 RepID=A0A0V0YVN0_9BILA|nr:hypothetical protein T12_1558 [Trichinella patagoniensis]